MNNPLSNPLFSNLKKNIAHSVGIIAKLHYYLPNKTLITLYYSLVHLHLLYALPVWAYLDKTYKTYLDKLRKLQNKAIHIVSKILYVKEIHLAIKTLKF